MELFHFYCYLSVIYYIFTGKQRSLHYLGQIIFHLALMYLGFEFFHNAFQILSHEYVSLIFIRTILTNPLLGFLLGLGLSAIFRSSNTVVVLVQAAVGIELMLSPTAFLSGAVAIIIGANVGTIFINMLVGYDRLPNVKKANWLHFSFNFSTALLWLFLLPFMIKGVHIVSQELNMGFRWLEVSVFQWQPTIFYSSRWFNIWQLAMAHTLFNITVILVWFPLTILALKLGFSLFSEKEKIGSNGTTYLDRRALQSPALALILATHEINQMANISLEMLKSARLAFLKGQVHLLNGINRDETIVDDLQEQITFYLSALLSQNSLTESQSHRLGRFIAYCQ